MSRLTDEELNKLGRVEVERLLGTNFAWDKANQDFAQDWLARLDRADEIASMAAVTARADSAASRAESLNRSVKNAAWAAAIAAMIAAAPVIISVIKWIYHLTKP